ncbi:hypothetical protein G6F60_014533 [Rhizopus arrhizus]|nr:hypothetical protein G6F60_014533 [Rhizopus arrhizus]
MSDELEVDGGSHAPIWAAFGDLMSVLLGAFVLILVGVVAVQLELSQRLDQEVKQRQAEAKRLQTLEQALAGPLAAGRVTLVDGRIGITGRPGAAAQPGRAFGRLPGQPRRNPDGQRLHR